MNLPCRWIAALTLSCLPGLLHAAPPDFDRAVAPILIERCHACHSGPKPKGGLDLTRRKSAESAVGEGKPDAGELWKRIVADEMPPKKPLPEKEKLLIKEWLASGAKWGSDPIDPFRLTTSKRAGLDWWSLQPVKPVSPPAVKNVAWTRNVVDHYILAGLENAGLRPSPEADRRTLVRRLHFDLVGLPPSPEDIASALADTSPDWYEKRVDRLLASPHHGERWARHWLDVVRYGESDGFERNASRRNAWPYHDWVIEAINRDMPYDEFVRLQLAADVLAPEDAGAVRALGFLVAGVHNTVLGNDQMRAIARQDELEDIVGSVAQTFLGLTVNCARCHDHKFDPIRQTDFYRLASALSGVQYGERALPAAPVQKDLVRLTREKEQLDARLKAIEEPARRAVLAARVKMPGPVAPSPLAAWDFRTGLKDGVGSMDASIIGGASSRHTGGKVDGRPAFARTAAIPRQLKEKTLEAWVRLDNLKQQGGGVITLQTPDGSVFDSIVFGEREPGRWMAGSDGFTRTQSFSGIAETEADRQPVHFVIVYSADGTITGYRNGLPYGKPYRSKGIMTYEANKAVVVFGVRHEPTGGNRMLAGTIVQARLYDRALSADEVAASARSQGAFVTEAELFAQLKPDERTQRAELMTTRGRLESELSRLSTRTGEKYHLASFSQPPVTKLLNRGQYNEPGEVVAPEILSALGGQRKDGLAPDAPEAERRRRLAAWIAHPDNPLFARAAVNRLWHHHFGIGIVETPNDFGFNGGRPSHPALLDHLASELIERRFSLREIHRLIVTSSAYRQSSRPDPKARALDADNRLVWRQSPRRVEAEVLRDAILTASGELNRALYGKGFSDYREYHNNGTTYFDPIDPIGPEFHRRSVYRFTPRGGNQGLLDAFDCPDPAAAAPRRTTTTTPIQALALWNNGFTLRMADTLARRVEREIPEADLDRRIARAFTLTLQRNPHAEETAPARKLVERHGLKALARALFNTNEFVTVE